MNIRAVCICAGPLVRQTFSTNFDALRCRICGSRHFVANAPLGSEYRYDGANEKYAQAEYLYGKQVRWAHKKILKQNWANCKVLEIGCFNGFFLDELRKAGADVYGFDVNRDALAVGEKLFGLKGRLSNSMAELSKHGPFDAIFCIDVLEHLDRPEEVLAEARSLIAEKGRIVIAGPIAERRFHDKSDYPPHHMWWFSQDGLDLFIKNNGFDVTSKLLQYDGLLLLRNFLGKLAHGNSNREYYGETKIGLSNMQGSVISILYAAASIIGTVLLTAIRMPYCSAIFTVTKSSINKNG